MLPLPWEQAALGYGCLAVYAALSGCVLLMHKPYRKPPRPRLWTIQILEFSVSFARSICFLNGLSQKCCSSKQFGSLATKTFSRRTRIQPHARPARRFWQHVHAHWETSVNIDTWNLDTTLMGKCGVFKMDFFGVLFFALGLASVTCANLLEESHFNPQESCENFHYGGMRLKTAEVIVGGKVFDWKNCGEVVPIDEVNKEIPIVKFSQVHLVVLMFADAVTFTYYKCQVLYYSLHSRRSLSRARDILSRAKLSLSPHASTTTIFICTHSCSKIITTIKILKVKIRVLAAWNNHRG